MARAHPAPRAVTRRGRPGWLLEFGTFTVLYFGEERTGPICAGSAICRRCVSCGEREPSATAVGSWATPVWRAPATTAPGVTYLIRPDQHVAARFAHFDPDALSHALARATLREAA
jgi:3-(3-hydroxy-phenyl)propionate hydroxylase